MEKIRGDRNDGEEDADAPWYFNMNTPSADIFLQTVTQHTPTCTRVHCLACLICIIANSFGCCTKAGLFCGNFSAF